MKMSIAIDWEAGPVEGHIEVTNGKLLVGCFTNDEGKFLNDWFSYLSTEPCRLALVIDGENMEPGANATMVSICTDINPFTFFLRDVDMEYPIFIPDYGVVVTDAEDPRSFKEIVKAIQDRMFLSNLQRISMEPEESYETAVRNVRELRCPVWLGLSRDMRIFEMDFRHTGAMLDWIQPRFHGSGVPLEETGNVSSRYEFLLGRGWGCTNVISRRLEDGVLPIFRGEIVDDDIRYECIAFVTLEQTKLLPENLRGTHYLVADGHSAGHIFTAEQQQTFESLLPEEMNRSEETVLFFRAKAVNTAAVPRYAFFKTIFPAYGAKYSFDGENGIGMYAPDRVFCISKLNGNSLPQEEVAVLIGPGESVIFEFCLPHRPISHERALKLGQHDFMMCLDECRTFWRDKLASAAKMILPEKRLDEMTKAGILHLDLITYGIEPEGTLAPTIGVYSPIGSESAPIIQFMDSMGWHDVARRSLMYFLEKQHEDGFMQNFGGYMLETGCALWSIGEHYRYTHDDDWVREITPKLLKSCEFIKNWRKRNQRDDLRGKGYGMMEGKVGDPEDAERIFMLNGYAYLGLSRVAEMLAYHEPEQSKQLKQLAAELKTDIRTALFESLAHGSVVPLGDGSWCPTVSPWAGDYGPKCLFAKGGKWYTHGAISCRDSLSGPLYLVFQEVIEPCEQATTFMLNYHNELFCMRNVAFSQPYYSRHPFVHLKRDEVKPFLKAHYNGFASLADRQTYSFWEHYFHASPHKTHEEAWFLMQTRWMLYMEEGETLKMLRGIPRSWLENGNYIELDNVASYFGPLSLLVRSKLDSDFIEARVTCVSDRRPKCVEIRLPHPEGQKGVSVRGAIYNAESETVRIESFEGYAEIMLCF